MPDKSDVVKIAKLAKLSFTENELNDFIKQFNNILDMVKVLQDIDCTNIEPLKSISTHNQPMRTDLVANQALASELLSNAPGAQSKLAKEVKCFVVPKVIE